MTYNEHGNEMIKILDEAIEAEGRSDAAREFALARTALEDALTRYNSGRYRQLGVWKRVDPDRLDDRHCDAG